MIPLENRDNAISEAAELAFYYAWRRVFDEQATAQIIALAVAPPFGIRWIKKIIAALDRRQNDRRVNQLLSKVRNYALPRIEYDRPADLFKLAYLAPEDFPPEWEERRTISDRYRMERRRSWAILAAVVSQLISAGVNSTLELAALGPVALDVLTAPLEGRHAIRNFWRAARMDAAKASSADALILNQQDVDVQAFQRDVKRHRAELSRTDPDHGPGCSCLRLPEGFDRLGALDRTKAIRSSAQASSRADRFFHDRTHANLLKQVRGSLPVLCSALNCYVAFCELREAQLFPVTERLVLEWSAVFNNTATFANYVSRIQKICFFIGSPVSWLTPAVRHVAKGLGKCQDNRFKFPNFIRIELLLRTIRHETVAIEFEQACRMSFLIAFRVPSETLQLVRAYRADEICAFSPHREKASIWVRTTPDGCFLVAKFKWRKNITGGCVLRRPCFC